MRVTVRLFMLLCKLCTSGRNSSAGVLARRHTDSDVSSEQTHRSLFTHTSDSEWSVCVKSVSIKKTRSFSTRAAWDRRSVMTAIFQGANSRTSPHAIQSWCSVLIESSIKRSKRHHLFKWYYSPFSSIFIIAGFSDPEMNSASTHS